MQTMRVLRRPSVVTILLVVLGLVMAIAQVARVVAADGPAPTANVTLSVSPTTGLVDGQQVTYTANTSGGTALFGVTVHLCRSGFAASSYNGSNFGFVGAQAIRCVNQPGIIAGTGLAGAEYEQSDLFGGNPAVDNTSGPQTIAVGTGAVSWANDSGFPGTSGDPSQPHLLCDATHPCDLVFKVDLTGSPATTYLVEALHYAEGGGGTTTTTEPPTSTTTTTEPPTSTTTTTTEPPTSTSTTSTSTTSTTTTTTEPPTTSTTSTTTTSTLPPTTTTLPIGQQEGPFPTADAALSAAPVTGLAAGGKVGYTVTTSNATALFSVNVHLCRTGFSAKSYNASNFGYVGAPGTRCVNGPGIVSGTTGLSGLDSSGYEQQVLFTGTETTTGAQEFTVGTGSVSWANDSGFAGGPEQPHLRCDETHPCDLVFKVQLTGSPETTYFVKTVRFGNDPTTTTSTTTSTTTTTLPGGSTTTTTTAPPGPLAVSPTQGGVGSTFAITSTGWKPDSDVAVTFHSDPIALGTYAADAQGGLQKSFAVPAVEPGAHTVELVGTGVDDQPRTLSVPYTVAGSTNPGGGGSGGTAPTGTGGTAFAPSALAFTGSGGARDLASLGVFLMAVGVHLLAMRRRRMRLS